MASVVLTAPFSRPGNFELKYLSSETKIKKSGTGNYWQGITLSNALIIFLFPASKLRGDVSGIHTDRQP